MEYILLTFASEDNADKNMNVISVKSSESIFFSVKFFILFPHLNSFCGQKYSQWSIS